MKEQKLIHEGLITESLPNGTPPPGPFR
uniref:Translational initiation factor 1 n=2 Tax=Liriope TaxID=39528 RepID=A0A7D5SHY5_LIRMU|nr:translational initiation factor 1 [Liriope muscari]QLH57342.1 translational initiation factor 1 [Liriope spicata]